MLDSWQFWAVLSAVFAALAALFAKAGVVELPSDLAVLIRTFVILVALAIFLSVTRQLSLTGTTVNGRAWLFLALSGIAGAASWIAYYRALRLGDVSRVAPIDRMSVALVAVLGVIFLGERLSTAHWLGVALAVAASLLVAIG
jgi:transporter family protein